MKTEKYMFLTGVRQLFRTRLLFILLVMGIACSFVALDLTAGLAVNEANTLFGSTATASFTIKGSNFADDLLTYEAVAPYLNGFGPFSILSWEAHSFTDADGTDQQWLLCGYSGTYVEGMYFAESSGRFFSKDELSNGAPLAYGSTMIQTEDTLQKMLPEGYKLIGSGGIRRSLILEKIGSYFPESEQAKMVLLVPMPNFKSLHSKTEGVTFRFYEYSSNQENAIAEALSSLFPISEIIRPVKLSLYSIPYVLPKVVLCLMICAISMINIMHLFLYLVRQSRHDMAICAICGATRQHLLRLLVWMWSVAVFFGSIIGQIGFFFAQNAFAFLHIELFFPPAIYVAIYLSIWFLPYLICFPALLAKIRLQALFERRIENA